MRKIFVLLMVFVLFASSKAYAVEDRIAELEKRIEELEQRIAILESYFEVETEAVEEDPNAPNFYLVNGSGSTENGDKLIIYLGSPKITYTVVGYRAWNFDGSLKSYIYIDGELADTTQLADTQAAIGLSDNALDLGDHEVTVKQYPNNDETAEPCLVQTEIYTVEE